MGLILGIIGAIASAAVSVTKALAVVGMAVQGLKVVGNAIMSIAKALGIVKPERDIEEFGDRALQATELGMTPDKYASYEAWVKAIEADDWGYDPEKNIDKDPQEKIMKGIEVSTAVAMERFPNIQLQNFFSLAGNNPEFFTVERMDEIGKLAESDPGSFEKVVNYVTGASNDHATIDAASDILMGIEQVIDPTISEDSAYDRVAGYKGMK